MPLNGNQTNLSLATGQGHVNRSPCTKTIPTAILGQRSSKWVWSRIRIAHSQAEVDVDPSARNNEEPVKATFSADKQRGDDR
jgi:hypothetical protein